VKLLSGLSLLAVLRAVAARVLLDPATSPGRPHAQFVALAGEADLDQWFARSMLQPVVLFLHDPGCPISAAAHRQVAKLEGEIGLIDVRGGRSLSRAVETRTGVRHESPQVIMLRHGRPVWSASHFAITTDAVDAARREA
jgi:bacillithiol system protein YtxJ